MEPSALEDHRTAGVSASVAIAIDSCWSWSWTTNRFLGRRSCNRSAEHSKAGASRSPAVSGYQVYFAEGDAGRPSRTTALPLPEAEKRGSETAKSERAHIANGKQHIIIILFLTNTCSFLPQRGRTAPHQLHKSRCVPALRSIGTQTVCTYNIFHDLA